MAINKPIRFLHGEIKTPPFSVTGRNEAGKLLRKVQHGMSLSMPLSRPMPSIGARCHELRVRDGEHNWRIIYRIDADAITVAEVFDKKTEETPQSVIKMCQQRLRDFDAAK